MISIKLDDFVFFYIIHVISVIVIIIIYFLLLLFCIDIIQQKKTRMLRNLFRTDGKRLTKQMFIILYDRPRVFLGSQSDVSFVLKT